MLSVMAAYIQFGLAMIVAELFYLLVLYQGGKWRERGQAKEREAADK